MVMMLNHIFGMPHSYRFESWMWYFGDQVMEEGDRIVWAGLISDNLNEQLMNLEHKMNFYMRSYVIYMLPWRTNHDGLGRKGLIGSRSQHLKVHECYPQLHLYSKDDYMRVNDVFSMCIVRTLQKRPHIRMSMGAMKLVKEYGTRFIQFPNFSYI